MKSVFKKKRLPYNFVTFCGSFVFKLFRGDISLCASLCFIVSFLFLFIRVCVRRAEAGSGKSNCSSHLLQFKGVRWLNNTSDDLCWQHGWRSGLLPGSNPMTFVFSHLVRVELKLQISYSVRETVVGRWYARHLLETGSWQELWVGVKVVQGPINRACTAEWLNCSSGLRNPQRYICNNSN